MYLRTQLYGLFYKETKTMRNALAVVGAALLLGFGTANAHTVSIGYENAGPGSLTFWYGSYHNYDGVTELTEGTFNLVGINGNPYPSTTVSFTLSTGTKPAGLTDGTTNFYATNAGPLSPTDVDNLCGCFSWQGVTFTGLSPGQYQFTYIPIANPSAHWDPWNAQVQTNVVTVTQGQLGGPVAIPTLSQWAMWVMASLLGLWGMVMLHKRKLR